LFIAHMKAAHGRLAGQAFAQDCPGTHVHPLQARGRGWAAVQGDLAPAQRQLPS